MERSRLKVLVACATGIVVCGAILLTGPEPLEASLPEGKPLVSVGKLERTVSTSNVSAFGALTPRQTLQLTTQVPGEITWISDSLVAGSQVDEGDLLFRIEERDYAIAVARAEAGYAQAQTKVDLERGQSEFARHGWESWQKTNGGERPPKPLALREPQQAEAVAMVKAARAELDRANLELERTAVRAPWPASVIRTNAVVGQVLSVGEITATLFPLDFGVVELQVPARTVRLLDAGIDRVELWPVNEPSAQPIVGVFEGIVRNLTEDTRLATVRVRIDEPLQYEGWAYGMHLEARVVTTQQRSVALIPADLIVSGNLIWVYRNGQARRHQVHPIESSDLTVSVEDNFSEGDALILERPIGLFDGADVDVAGT